MTVSPARQKMVLLCYYALINKETDLEFRAKLTVLLIKSFHQSFHGFEEDK